MKLHEGQRSKLAERIAARWVKTRMMEKVRIPAIYFIRSRAARRTGIVWGYCHHRGPYGFITLHVGPAAESRDIIVLLAHELAHWYDYQTSAGKWANDRQPHGERFQIILWRLLPRVYWPRASAKRWITGKSAHRPKYQPEQI